MDFNACVNCGNTLASWAELCEPKSASRQLHDAVSQYHAALQLDSEDNEVGFGYSLYNTIVLDFSWLDQGEKQEL